MESLSISPDDSDWQVALHGSTIDKAAEDSTIAEKVVYVWNYSTCVESVEIQSSLVWI